MALRLIIHYVGDIHQPLHCVNLVNSDYPEGDKGGNAFKLRYRYRVKNLHALWDSVMYKYRESVRQVICFFAQNFSP